MAKFEPFIMERMMGKWENVVQYNLSESGVHPLKLGELMALAGRGVADAQVRDIMPAGVGAGQPVTAPA